MRPDRFSRARYSNTKTIIEHYYRFVPHLTRQDGSAFDKAAQFGL